MARTNVTGHTVKKAPIDNVDFLITRVLRRELPSSTRDCTTNIPRLVREDLPRIKRLRSW